MSYGNMAWMDGGYMDQRALDAQRQAYQQQLDGQQQRDDAREAFQNSLLAQEQQRRGLETQSAADVQKKKIDTYGGILGGLLRGGGMQGGYSGYGASPFVMQTVNTQKKAGPFA